MNTANPWLVVATLSGLAAVAAGAYGAHGLEADDRGRDLFARGVQYHMWHTFALLAVAWFTEDRKSTRLNSSHVVISYAVFCLKKKNNNKEQ